MQVILNHLKKPTVTIVGIICLIVFPMILMWFSFQEIYNYTANNIINNSGYTI